MEIAEEHVKFDPDRALTSPAGTSLWTLEEVEAYVQKNGSVVDVFRPTNVGKTGSRNFIVCMK